LRLPAVRLAPNRYSKEAATIRRGRQPTPSVEISVEAYGERHVGSHTIDRGLIRVFYAEAFTKTTQVGNAAPDMLARALLHELVSERSARIKP
jgi:hypothetical protein